MSDRKYIMFRPKKARRECYYHLDITRSDPYDDADIRSYDEKLHRTLNEIFRKLCLTSGQIKKLISAPGKHTGKKSTIFKLIFEQEPKLGRLLQKRKKLSLLWIAVLCGYQNSAELLVHSGVDLNDLYELDGSSQITKKSTVLHALLLMYPSTWNERFIDLVINHGVDLKAQDLRGSTALHYAVWNGRVKVAKMLLELGADVNAARYASITPLLDAVRTSEADELVTLLMNYGADINVKGTDGFNALRYLASSKKEKVDLARFFIEKGLSPREVALNQYQPIDVAVVTGHIELVKLFLDHGANVNAQDVHYNFLLLIAARECKDPEMLLTLLKRGANIKQKTVCGQTALHGLVRCNNFSWSDKNMVEKMRILISVGADMMEESANGLTSFEIVHRKGLGNGLMLRRLVLDRACAENWQLSLTSKLFDKWVIRNYPILWDEYTECIEEINRMKSTKFIKSGIFYELLLKCQCRMAELMRNHEFKREFSIYDFGVFPKFAEDIVNAFERAELFYHQSVLKQENFINEAFYNSFSYIIVKQVVRYTLDCEICEMRKIVSASSASSSASSPAR